MWRETAQFKKVEYRRIELPTARVLTVRREWPPDLQWALQLFLESPDSEGVASMRTPRFLFLSRSENKLLYTTWGYRGWTDYAVPWLDRRVGK